MAIKTLYLDTEFTQLSIDRELISLALVAADGAEFYVELLDGWSEEACSDFTREIVLPQLDLQRFGVSRQEATLQLQSFLQQQGPVEIVGDALRWDWPLLLDLLGASGLPDTVVGCREVDLSGLADDQGAEEPPHHALLDARLICRGASQLEGR